MKTAKASSAVRKLNPVLKDAGKAALRKAFRHNIPVSIFENGKIYLIYPDNQKVEATQEMLRNYPNL